MSNTILITGTSSGIGKEAALFFANKGWNVVATMRNPEKETTLTSNKNILVTKLDVQDGSSISKAIETAIAHFGKIDVLVNNAGYGEYGVFESTSKEQTRAQYEVNVFGVMDTIRAILPHFRSQKGGRIINISSGAGRFTLPLLSLYASSKFALEGFSEALSFELSALNIVVKIVEPGGSSTNFGKVSAERFSQTNAIQEYEPFVNGVNKLYDSMRAMKLATGEEVAAVIYEAATDEQDTLRYIVGNEDFKKRILNRHTMKDQDYINSVKEAYLKYL